MSKTFKGRAPSILLTANGHTRNIMEWAAIVSPEDPQRAEFVIRDRYQKRRRRNSPVTDAQVIYGLSYQSTEEMPMEMGLPRLCRMWVLEAMDLVMPQVEEHLSMRMAAYLSQKHGTPPPGEFITTDKSLPAKRPKPKLNPVPGVNPSTPALKVVMDWLKANNLDDPLIGDNYRSAQLLMMCQADEPTPELLAWHFALLDETGLSAPVPEIKKELPYKTATKHQEEWWEPYIKTRYIIDAFKDGREPDPFTPTDNADTLTEEEEMELEAPAYTQEFCRSSKAHVNEVVDRRFLKSQNEYLCLMHNKQAIDRLDGPSGTQDGFVKFLNFAFFDIGFRCVLQISDFRTLNRAQHVYFLSALCRKFKASFVGRNTDLCDSLLEKLSEWGLNPLPLSQLHRHPLLCHLHSRGNEQVAASLKPLLDYADRQGLDYNTYQYWATLDHYEHETLIDLDPLFIPAEIRESDKYQGILDSLVAATNYGRNMAMWPEGVVAPRPDMVPCDLYDDPIKGYDYTVFDGAPLLVDGSHTFVVLEGVG
ncbi:hypothetical protein [Methylovulum miyakonense]|uniref:hypothetical protein n=1 Tax=Methylovulum miyakonense TaxID=645578 RepID=UPI0003770328|nr:hypothetical protein [Methylovulum miyakonense]